MVRVVVREENSSEFSDRHACCKQSSSGVSARIELEVDVPISNEAAGTGAVDGDHRRSRARDDDFGCHGDLSY
jgi:hypothetical protein